MPAAIGAVTWKVTVAWPSGGKVTLPFSAVVLVVVVIAAPELKLVTMLVIVPKPVGRASAKVAVVAVLGPALLITKVKVNVPPALTV